MLDKTEVALPRVRGASAVVSQVKHVAFCSLTDLTKLVLGHPRRRTWVSQSDVRCTC